MPTSAPNITCTPIGIIHSEHSIPEKTPIQSTYAKGCQGRVEIFPEFAEGLRDLEGFSHLYLLYHFHRAHGVRLTFKPYLQDIERGVFSTRSPFHPNNLGLSVVQLIGREENILHIDGTDILDGTPVLDIKPYTAKFDIFTPERNGWQDEVDEPTAQQRGRRGYGQAD